VGRAFHEVGAKYPTVKRDYAHVDATCMWFVKNPEWFDVIVTDNMFGDIITDLAAMIQGGLGVAAGGNINPEGTEHVRADGRQRAEIHRPERHQPARRHQRRRHDAGFPRRSQSRRGHRNAVVKIINTKIKSLAAGKMGHGTREVGDLVAAAV
jgi:3-isopropylmalate dehydrogenase